MSSAHKMARLMGGQPSLPGDWTQPEARACDVTRTVAAGGDLSSLLLHPSIVPLQRIYRRLPQDGIYTATQQRPFTFEMGAFKVPKSMAFAVAEFQFDLFRFNGASPWDMVPLEARRFPLSVGYDLNFDQYRKGNVEVEMLPVPTQTQQNAFSPEPSGGTIFGSGRSVDIMQLFGATPATAATVPTLYADTVASGPNAAELTNSVVATTGAGNALLPQNQDTVQGPRRMPFTFYAREGQAVQLRVAIFGTIPIPIAFFEARLSGYLMPLITLDTMLASVAPCTSQQGTT